LLGVSQYNQIGTCSFRLGNDGVIAIAVAYLEAEMAWLACKDTADMLLKNAARMLLTLDRWCFRIDYVQQGQAGPQILLQLRRSLQGSSCILRQIACDQYMIDVEHGRLLPHQDGDRAESKHLRNSAAQEQLGQSTPAVRAHDKQIARFLPGSRR